MNNLLPETDLVAISEREVIEAARIWVKECNSFFATHPYLTVLPKLENLLAAVSLLESREQIRKQLEAKNEGK